jgi:hypothetical protein
MSFEIFNINKHKIFTINNFSINKPLNILFDNFYLSYPENNNYIDLFLKDDNSDRQKWIIEQDDNDKSIFYIRGKFNRYNYTQYMGAPNTNNNVYLYTSKNNFTKWSINNLSNNTYEINYIGSKFNKSEINLIIARYDENIDWINPYYDITTIYNKNIKPIFNDITNNIGNVGEEGHTYLFHMYNYYDKLSNKNIFLQGNPFVNNHTILFGIDNYDKLFELQPLGLKYLTNMDQNYIDKIINPYKICTNYGLEYTIIDIDGNLSSPLFHDENIDELNKQYMIEYNRPPFNNMNMMEGFLFRANFPYKNEINNVKFSLSPFFCLSKKLIKSYDKIVYLKLLSELIKLNPQGGTNGCILKRLWLYIFSLFDKNLLNNKNNNKYIITEPKHIETKELVVETFNYNQNQIINKSIEQPIIDQQIKQKNNQQNKEIIIQNIKRNINIGKNLHINNLNTIVINDNNLINSITNTNTNNYNYIHENIVNFNIIKDHINATLNNKKIININKFI